MIAPIPDKIWEQVYFDDSYTQASEGDKAVSSDDVKGGKYLQPEPVMREDYELAVTELEDFLQNGWDKFSKTTNV